MIQGWVLFFREPWEWVGRPEVTAGLDRTLSKPEQEDTEFQEIRSTETWIEVRCQENTAPHGPLEETAAWALHRVFKNWI